MATTFTLSFRATELEARAGIRAVIRRLGARRLGDDHLGNVEIVLAEAVNNVVEHAYSGTPGGEVQVCCDLDPPGLIIRICDTGHPLPDSRLPPGRTADLTGPRQDLPEGGFGWFLIRQLTSDISYERRDGCNCLFLGFDLGAT